MSEIIACGIQAHKEKVKEENKDLYTDEVADYLAKITNTRPKPKAIGGIAIFDEIDEKGFWVRQPNYLIKPFGDKKDDLKADKDRYIIYWSPGCNWSNRPVIARDILGLQDVIKERKVYGTGESNKYGWGFPNQKDFKDPDTGVYFLSTLYQNADPNFTGRATTPTLADYKEKKAVNNDYQRLTNYLEVQFRAFQPVDAPDLYPKKYRKEIDELNDWLFPNINDGHYRQAFARSPEAYKDGYNAFHNALEKLDKRLEDNRFVFGDYITDSDIRIYVSLVKWETDFYLLDTGPQKKRIREYKNIWGYLRDLFSLKEFKRYANLPSTEYNKEHRAYSFGNYLTRIGQFIDYEEEWAIGDERKKLSSDPEHVYLKHPKGETVEDYITEISQSQWNIDTIEARTNKEFKLSVDASINPLKGLLKNN